MEGGMIKGKYFHTREFDEATHRLEFGLQGLVFDYDPEKNRALVLLFEWWDGLPIGQHLKTVTDEWVFYDTVDEMKEAYWATFPKEEREHARRMDKYLTG